MQKYAIAIHGGAGTILKSLMDPEKEARYRLALSESLRVADAALNAGHTAVDAVEAAVRILEDNPIFNAGRGAVFTHGGKNELDAAVMDGHTLRAGAVACVEGVKNPVSLARAVMEKSSHVLMSGSGAVEFAKQVGVEFAPPEYFYSADRYAQLQAAREVDRIILDHTPADDKKFGTVGAVAVDKNGNVAAATSTGGMTNKQYGRIGDSPLIGAGTYANNKTCAISCTGHGEYFMRAVVAYDVSCLMEYKGYTLQHACEEVVMRKLRDFGGEGGLIAVDARGHVAMVFNSEGMYRASKQEGGEEEVAIFR